MPELVISKSRQVFDYTSLDAKTSEFVQQHTFEIRALMKRTAQGIVEIGQKLLSVKERLGHGQFEDWLKAEFEWGLTTAWRFMQVAETFPSSKLEDLKIAPSALYLLAAPSTSEAARSEAIARAKIGEAITYTVAKVLKQKYAPLPVKPKPEPEAVSPPQPTLTPAPLPDLRSQLEIVAINPQVQAKALAEATRIIVPQTKFSLSIPQSSQPVDDLEQPGIWWQLGRHLLYCGDPNSSAFLGRITEQVQLLLCFPKTTDWQPAIRATTCLIATKYLPQGRNLEQLDEFLESSVLFNSNLWDLVVSCFLPSPVVLSIVNRLDRCGMFAEPDIRQCNQVICEWKKAGLKAERVS